VLLLLLLDYLHRHYQLRPGRNYTHAVAVCCIGTDNDVQL